MAIRTRGNGLEVDVQVTLGTTKRRYRETINASIPEAKAFEARVKADLLEGRDPEPYAKKAQPQGLPLEWALEQVWERYWSNGGQARTVRSNMSKCVEFFGSKRDLAAITSSDMDDFIVWLRKQELAPSTIRQKACVMSKAFSHYHRRGNLKSIPRVELPKIGDNTRDRVITEDEFKELLRITREDLPGTRGADLTLLWTVLLDTGARPSELRMVKAGDIRDDLMTFKDTKSGVSRTVPLTDRARFAADVLSEKHGEHPFLWASPATIRHAWDFARERMGLTQDAGFIPYALRHTCATRLYAKTRDLMLVQRWMGHADIKMTLRYAKLQPGDLQNARDLLDA